MKYYSYITHVSRHIENPDPQKSRSPYTACKHISLWDRSFGIDPFLRKKQRNMDKDQIIKAARKLSAESFLESMHHNHVFTEILDQDNISNANDGFLNVIVEGLPAGETLLFINGKLA